jgi:hypothetical protein
MADLVYVIVNLGLMRRFEIEALWWAYNCLDETEDRATYLGGRAYCAERLLAWGEVP